MCDKHQPCCITDKILWGTKRNRTSSTHRWHACYLNVKPFQKPTKCQKHMISIAEESSKATKQAYISKYGKINKSKLLRVGHHMLHAIFIHCNCIVFHCMSSMCVHVADVYSIKDHLTEPITTIDKCLLSWLSSLPYELFPYPQSHFNTRRLQAFAMHLRGTCPIAIEMKTCLS